MNTLKKKMIWAVIIALAGLSLFVVTMFRNGNMSSTASFALAMVGVSIARIIQFYRISKDQQRLKKYEIEQKEERLITIAEKSGRFVFLLTIFLEFIAIFVLIIIGKDEIATIVSSVTAIQALVYLITYYYLCKKY